MRPEDIERDWLTLERWLRDCAVPAACVVMVAVFGAIAVGLRGEALDALAGAMGFAALLLSAWQGMDRMVALRIHRTLMRHHRRTYRARLTALAHPPRTVREVLRLIEWIDRSVHS